MQMRISTASIYTGSITDFTRLQGDLAKLQNQITSGRDSDTFQELGSRILRTQNLEESIKRTDKYLSNNELIESRLSLMDGSLSQLQDVASDLASQIALKRSPSGSVVDLKQFADTALERVRDALSAQQAGRFLFSGSKSNQPPVSEDGFLTTNIIDEQPTNSYYQGDSVGFTAKVSDNLDVEYSINGGDPAFQKLIGAIHRLAEAEDYTDYGDNQNRILEAAMDTINESIGELAGVRDIIGNNLKAVEDANIVHIRMKEEFNNILDETTGTDVVAASVRVSLNESTLQAVLQTFSRISALTLTDFLR